MVSKWPSIKQPVRIGTRGSPLALAQANEVQDRLMAMHNWDADAFEIVIIRTTGDRIIDRPLSEIGGKGLFTREIEDALALGRIDLAVHSMKDMPTEQPNGLMIDCFLEREDPRDALISRTVSRLDDLTRNDLIGTSSLRRRAQVLYRRPDLKTIEFRGNVQTRLQKLDDGVADCTFLAMAGLNRLHMEHVATAALSPEEMLPAVGQGVIGIERRVDDRDAMELLRPIHHFPTHYRVQAERRMLAVLDGSCQTPIAGLAELDGETLRLRGEVLRPDGSECIHHEMSAPYDVALELGEEVGQILRNEAGSGFFN